MFCQRLFLFFLSVLWIFSQFFILPLLLLCHIYIPSGGGGSKRRQVVFNSRGKNDKLQNKHDNLGQVNSQLPLCYLCSWIHSMTCSSFSCWLLVMRSLETLGRRAGLNFFLLPARCQRLSLIDQPAGGRRASSSVATLSSCFISASLSLLVLLPAFAAPRVCVSRYSRRYR